MYSTLIPCNICAGAIVQFGIIKVVYGESRNLPEDNGRELLVRYGVELADLDLGEAKRMLRTFIETKPEEWSADIGRWARREKAAPLATRAGCGCGLNINWKSITGTRSTAPAVVSGTRPVSSWLVGQDQSANNDGS